MNRGALAEYRVLDLSDDKALACGRFLADMGAEVIRVEPPGAVPALLWENLGKKSVTLDIELKEGRVLLGELIKKADALIEDRPPGYLADLGLDYSKLSKANPRLIMASISPFGGDGPYRDYKADDLVAGALGGQLYLNGEPGEPPLKLFGNQSYYLASLNAAIGILLALYNRRTTGEGQHIDISLQECTAACLDQVLVRYFYANTVAQRQGSIHGHGYFRVFAAGDGYVLVAMFYQWPTLLEWLESENMAEDLTDAKWQSRDYRLEHIEHIIAVLERWVKTHKKAELVEKAQMMRLPWAEVASPDDLLASPQLRARNFWREIEYQGRKYRIPGSVL
jgi:benzylsuccinate CoA-transferase BbsE subunit